MKHIALGIINRQLELSLSMFIAQANIQSFVSNPSTTLYQKVPPSDTNNNDENESIYQRMSLVDVPDFPQVENESIYEDLVDCCRENGNKETLF